MRKVRVTEEEIRAAIRIQGNASFERVTPEQLAVRDELVAQLPPGSTLMEWDDATYTASTRTDLELLDVFADDRQECLDDPAVRLPVHAVRVRGKR